MFNHGSIIKTFDILFKVYTVEMFTNGTVDFCTGGSLGVAGLSSGGSHILLGLHSLHDLLLCEHGLFGRPG